MKAHFDTTSPMQKLQHAFVRACLGPFTIVQVVMGWSPTVVGQLKGRIDVPGAATGYLFLDLQVVNKRVVLCSWQLA